MLEKLKYHLIYILNYLSPLEEESLSNVSLRIKLIISSFRHWNLYSLSFISSTLIKQERIHQLLSNLLIYKEQQLEEIKEKENHSQDHQEDLRIEMKQRRKDWKIVKKISREESYSYFNYNINRNNFKIQSCIIFYSSLTGLGLYSKEIIRKNQIIDYYCGELLSSNETQRRYSYIYDPQVTQNKTNKYFSHISNVFVFTFLLSFS